jgi:leucyl aminopeptidase
MITQLTPSIKTKDNIPQLDAGAALALCVFRNGPKEARFEGDPRFGLIEDLLQSGEFTAEEGETMAVSLGGNGMGERQRVILIGTGSPDDFSVESLRNAAAIAVREARAHRCSRLTFVPPVSADQESLPFFFAQGAVLGLYENDLYKKPEESTVLDEITLVTSGESELIEARIKRGVIVGESMNWARELADEPGGSLPPREFARRAADMATEFGLKVETLNASELRELGLGGLWGVGKGSDEDPYLIVIRYEPEVAGPAAGTDDLWAFVGKGITFDTGGISIKPAKGMEEMKSDMAGGAAALGAIRAIAQLKPKRRVVAIVPTAENMPSGHAIKPGDVVQTLGGFTIEVVDTDAEGRLVLVDGIAYAKRLGASRIVDLATLTGSIIVALGDFYSGLFSNNDDWAADVSISARHAGERVWRMPVGDDYKKLIESTVADFKNYGGRPDATGAALLLSKFAGETPWVHLDIAATAWRENPGADGPKGATGAGIPTLVELVLAAEG